MAAAPPPRAPQALMEEIVEEIILRLPHAEPASLVRAALVCKPWCRLISSPRFRRRFRAFHRTPPMLGFICNTRKGCAPYVARFVSTSSFRPPQADHHDWLALDARHGYVLLSSVDSGSGYRLRLFVVWNPMTDERWQLPPLAMFPFGWNATVLCAASGAGDHLDCLHGRFLVVLMFMNFQHTTLRVYSSGSVSWSQETLVPRCAADEIPTALIFRKKKNLSKKIPTALVGNTIYFSIGRNRKILSYDLATRATSVICLPPNSIEGATALMTLEDGGLGIARAEEAGLCLWSMETSSNGDIGWAQIRVIEHEKLLPVKALTMWSAFIAFATGIGVLFVRGDDGLFTIDLKSEQVKKVLDKNYAVSVVPYLSFYTPVLGSTNTDEGQGVDASSA